MFKMHTCSNSRHVNTSSIMKINVTAIIYVLENHVRICRVLVEKRSIFEDYFIRIIVGMCNPI